MAGEALDEAVAYFTELEDIERRQAGSSSDLTADLLQTAHQTTSAKLEELCQTDDVRLALTGILQSVEQAVENLEAMKGVHAITEPAVKQKIEESEAKIQERREDPRYRLAARVVGLLTVEAADASAEQADSFLSRPAEEVAEMLKGKKLVFGRKSVVIADVRPQDGAFNAKYLSTRPLFGPNRRDVYVAAVRKYTHLFFRAGDAASADACVSIQAASHRGGELKNADSVATALGLPKEHVGNLEIDGDTVKIVGLEPRKK